MRVLLGVGAVVVMLAGCATTPIPLVDAKPVPPNRIFTQTSISARDTSSITVVRDIGYLGAGCDFGFYLDGRLVARLAAGERLSLDVSPGEYILGAATVGRALCSQGEDQRREIASIVKAGDKKIYRISARTDGGIAIEPTTMLGGR